MANFDLKSPAVQKLSLAILLAAAALGMFYFTHLIPFGFPNNRDQIASLRSDYEKKSSELARARASVADLPRFEAEYDQLHQRWELASELLPADRQLSTLLRKITLAGQQAGVQFTMFKPGGMRPNEYHTEMPMQISVTGPYHNIGSFLSELSNMRRIVTVSSLHLTTSTRAEDGTTNAEFVASAYSLNTSPVAAAAAPSPKGDSRGKKS
jgi:type IV pilus assembly protein PilO